MTFRKSFLYTKIIVGISIFCSLLSFLISPFGLSEIYPFFHYKLYTQPLGSKNTHTEYRIYSRASPEGIFKRNLVRETQTFDFDGYTYTFYFLVGKSLEQGEQQSEFKKKLLVFAKHIIPGQTEYKIVSETYHPMDLLDKNVPYDTTTVILF